MGRSRYQIVQSPGFIAITYEMIHETRVIPLDGRPVNPLPLYECHEGNYGLKNILSAARAEERAGKP